MVVCVYVCVEREGGGGLSDLVSLRSWVCACTCAWVQEKYHIWHVFHDMAEDPDINIFRTLPAPQARICTRISANARAQTRTHSHYARTHARTHARTKRV